MFKCLRLNIIMYLLLVCFLRGSGFLFLFCLLGGGGGELFGIILLFLLQVFSINITGFAINIKVVHTRWWCYWWFAINIKVVLLLVVCYKH